MCVWGGGVEGRERRHNLKSAVVCFERCVVVRGAEAWVVDVYVTQKAQLQQWCIIPTLMVGVTSSAVCFQFRFSRPW